MTLSWGLLFRLMPPEQRGAVSGIATTTKGLGLIFGPLVAGLLIDISSPYSERRDGYQVLWPFCALPVLLVDPDRFSLSSRGASKWSRSRSY